MSNVVLPAAEPATVTEREPAVEPWDSEVVTSYRLLREAAAELEHLMRRRLKVHGLQTAMFELLLRLARSPEDRQRLTWLARELTVTTGGITRLVDRAEADGLVRREPCPDDARGSYAVITEEGKRRLRMALPTHLADAEELWLRQLGEDRETVLRRVRAVRDHARRVPVGRTELGTISSD